MHDRRKLRWELICQVVFERIEVIDLVETARCCLTVSIEQSWPIVEAARQWDDRRDGDWSRRIVVADGWRRLSATTPWTRYRMNEVVEVARLTGLGVVEDFVGRSGIAFPAGGS